MIWTAVGLGLLGALLIFVAGAVAAILCFVAYDPQFLVGGILAGVVGVGCLAAALGVSLRR